MEERAITNNRKFARTARLVVALTLVTFAVAVNAGLFAHWSLDEADGTIIYDSAGTKHGLIYGAQRVSGVLGNALWFNGNNAYVGLPDNAPVWLPQNNFTLAFWARCERDPLVAGEVFLDLNFADSGNPDNELGIQVGRNQDTGKLGCTITTTTNPDESLFSNQVLLKNTWYHIAAVRNGTTQAIYINGVLDNWRTMSADPIDYVGGYDDDRVNIGRTTRLGLPATYHLMGKMDDIRIYNHALSEEEITSLVPEPATVLTVSLGLLLIRRKVSARI